MSIILKGILALFWLLLVPAAIGILFMSKRKDICPEACLPFGYLVLFSLMEIFTLPLTFLEGTPSYSDSIVWWGGSTSGSSGSCIGCWK